VYLESAYNTGILDYHVDLLVCR